MAFLIGTRKDTIRRRTTRAIWLGRAKKAGIIGGGAVFVLWVGAWLYLSGSINRTGEGIENKTLQITADMGFSVENILVEGRQYSDAEVLKAIINVQKGEPLFSFNPAEAKMLIERVDWVKSARVERRLPDTIYIGITERTPLALWQKDKQLQLIDTDGQVISTEGLKRFEDLIVVMGEGAPEYSFELLQNLSAEPALAGRTQSARWVDGRRWDMIMQKDIVVALPETDIGLALSRLAAAQEQDALLDKDITHIDLREPDKIAVRTRPGAVQEYKAGLKAGDDI